MCEGMAWRQKVRERRQQRRTADKEEEDIGMKEVHSLTETEETLDEKMEEIK